MMNLPNWVVYCLIFTAMGAVTITQANEYQKVIEQMEKSLLNSFGLKEKPNVDATNIKIPSHMMHLYKVKELHEKIHQNRIKRDTGEKEEPIDENQFVKPPKHLQIYGNTIRSFSHIESINDKFHPSNAMLLKFNVSSIPGNEILQHVELRLSHLLHHSTPPAAVKNIKRKFSRNEMGLLQRVRIYDILKPARGNEEEIRRLLDTKIIDSRVNDSISLDVGPAVKRWTKTPKSNYGLYVDVAPVKHHNSESNPLNDGTNLRLRRAAEVGVDSDEWSEEQPLLVVHTDDETNSARDKRDSPMSSLPYKRPLCRRQRLFVDFRKVEWNTWIVAPPGYDAFYCQGDCPYPLPSHLNATNHAVIQNIIHSSTPQRVPSACCVPIKHSAISMLYLDTDKKVVLKTYQDMIVESCGCH